MAVENINGCNALKETIQYDNRKKSKENLHKAGMAWWTSSKVNIILVIIFSAMDAMVLYSIFDEALTQSQILGIVMALGVATILNVLPLVIAKFVHCVLYKTIKHAKLMLSIFIVSFVLIYGGTVYLRFAYSDMYGQESQDKKLENTVSNETIQQSVDNSDIQNNKGKAVVVLLSISPLITSLLAFGIAFIGDDGLKKQIERLEIQQIEIDEKICDTKAAILQMENSINQDIKRQINMDEKTMNVVIDEIISRCDILKALSRQYLAEYLANPSATSKLSQEMLVQDNNPTDESN